MTSQPVPEAASTAPDDDLLCHCRKVPYGTVRSAIDGGQARSLADVQRATTACTRCFGCRFEIEDILQESLGAAYRRTRFVTRPEDEAGTGRRAWVARVLRRAPAPPAPKRMYTPVLHGLDGAVRTRVVLFHWHEDGEPPAPIDVRADLLALDGTRVAVWHSAIAAGTSAVLDVAALVGVEGLGGAGTLKLVLDADRVGSLRPYFQLVTPGGITSTHEKSSPKDPVSAVRDRGYFWTFPVGAGPRGSRAWFYAVNAVPSPLTGRELVWHATDGEEVRAPFPDLELDQAALIPLHEHFPRICTGGVGGSVRLTPTTHVAGHILRHDEGTDQWRVQHL
jgi:bacterioferritin-associated ferredoxin